MNRIDRLTAMILMLQGRRVVTAEQLAQHFEISVRTVYRDVTALGEAGVPIVAEAGVGYSLMRGYHMPPVMFTQQEAAALFTCGELSKQFGDESLKASLGDALLKVRAVLPEGRKDYVSRVSDIIGIPNRQAGSDDNSLMQIQEAVIHRRCLKLAYDAGNRGELSERVVEPLGIVFYGRHWHLIGWCRLRRDMRDFRLDRIQSWELLDEGFDGHESFSVVEYLEEEVDREALIPVILDCERWALERVLAEMPCRILEHQVNDDGWVRIEALAYSLDWLSQWMLGLGSSAIARSPRELGEMVAVAASAVVRLYQGREGSSITSEPS